MADVNTVNDAAIQPVQLAPGVGENENQQDPALVAQQQYDKAFDPEGFQQRQNGEAAQSLLNAATPTPGGTPTQPPLNQTLSNLGKVEPQQIADASRALSPIAPMATSSTQPATVAPPEPQKPQEMPKDPLQSAVEKSYAQQQASNAAIAGAVQAKAAADQAQFATAEKAYADAEGERQKTKAAFDADFNGRMNSYEQAVSDYKQAAGEKVVPGAIIANMDTSQKLQSGIFMALSAYGSALSGQENQALKVINNAINMDIDAQKYNLENKLRGARMGVESQQYLVSQMRDKFKDDESATLAARAAMLSMTQQQLNINASKLDQSTAAPKAQALNAQLEMQKQQVLGQLKVAQAQQFMLQQLGSGGANQGKPGYLDPAVLNVMKNSGGELKDRAESYVPGYGTSSGGQKDKEKFQEELQFKEPVLEAMDRVRSLKQDFSKTTDLTKRAQIESEIAGIKAKLKQGGLLHTNRFQPEILDFLNEFIGKPTSITSVDKLQMARFNQAYNTIQSDIDSAARLHGYDVPRRDFNATKYTASKSK